MTTKDDKKKNDSPETEHHLAEDLGMFGALEPTSSHFLARLRGYFMTGLIIVGPVAITIYVVWWFINLDDGWVKPLIPGRYLPDNCLPFNVPGVGLIIGISALMFVGAWYDESRQIHVRQRLAQYLEAHLAQHRKGIGGRLLFPLAANLREQRPQLVPQNRIARRRNQRHPGVGIMLFWGRGDTGHDLADPISASFDTPIVQKPLQCSVTLIGGSGGAGYLHVGRQSHDL